MLVLLLRRLTTLFLSPQANRLLLVAGFLCGTANVLASETDCQAPENAALLYRQFVAYRQAINTARAPKDLAEYFSPTFNRYFQQQLTKADSDAEKSRALAQYWDNLNSAADVVSVYRQKANCHRGHPRLEIWATLKSDQPDIGATIALWRITIEYSRNKENWLIDNIEFNPLKKTPKQIRLLNNFSVIP